MRLATSTTDLDHSSNGNREQDGAGNGHDGTLYRPRFRAPISASVSMSQLKEYAVLPQHVVHLDDHVHDHTSGEYVCPCPRCVCRVLPAARPDLERVVPSYATLAVQNTLLALIMHYSHVSDAPQHTYSAASTVLIKELVKGFISHNCACLPRETP